jgi:DoxX-like family
MHPGDFGASPATGLETVLTASEIAEFTYCPQSWWLRRSGVLGSAIGEFRRRDGAELHRMIGGRTNDLRDSEVASRLLRTAALFFALLAAFLAALLLSPRAWAASGVAAIVHFKPIVPRMLKAGVLESRLTFPIGTLKVAGAVGLLFGLVGVPLIGTAAAIGLILFFVCAIYTHIRAGDYSPQFGLAIMFLLLATAALVSDLATAEVSIHGQLR